MPKAKDALKRITLLVVTVVTVFGAGPMGILAQAAYATEEEPEETFTYNEDTNKWDSNKWRFDPASGTYVPVTAPAPVVQAPVETTNDGPDAGQGSANSIDTTGPDSNNNLSSKDNTNISSDVNSNNNIKNNLDSKAKTGNSNVSGNTKAGSARSGDAAIDATMFNVIHSTIGDTTGVAQFTTDINGDVRGDITLYPANYIKNTGPGSSNSTNSETNTTIKSRAASTSDINNTLDLDASSGNANVSGNTEAGDATTGNAHAVANIMNLINTIIAANQSFVGTINIYGNLDGDILISPDFIPQLISDNAGDANSTVENTLNVNNVNNDTKSIVNNVKLDADTGTANVSGNNTAGNATTGDAQTNLTILNLTGREVVAKNSLLVFINVLGKWVGVIVDAPQGATSAALGNGVSSNTIKNNTTIDTLTDTKDTITNNLTIKARSGDASVTDNTIAGSARTGNATASANILNMASSNFKLSDWFGVLFINVFGSWYGSFGVNTANGDVVPLTPEVLAAALENPGGPSTRFGFVPKPASTTFGGQATSAFSTEADDPEVKLASALVARGSGTGKPSTSAVIPTNPFGDAFTRTLMIAGGTIMAVGIALELLARRRKTAIA